MSKEVATGQSVIFFVSLKIVSDFAFVWVRGFRATWLVMHVKINSRVPGFAAASVATPKSVLQPNYRGGHR